MKDKEISMHCHRNRTVMGTDSLQCSAVKVKRLSQKMGFLLKGKCDVRISWVMQLGFMKIRRPASVSVCVCNIRYVKKQLLSSFMNDVQLFALPWTKGDCIKLRCCWLIWSIERYLETCSVSFHMVCPHGCKAFTLSWSLTHCAGFQTLHSEHASVLASASRLPLLS